MLPHSTKDIHLTIHLQRTALRGFASNINTKDDEFTVVFGGSGAEKKYNYNIGGKEGR